jgi:beta-lactam-binding protein with PASTA domain
VIGGLVAYAVTQSDDEDKTVVNVPAVVGMRAAQASDELHTAGLSPSTQNEANDEFGEGIVFSQAPAAGSQARENSVVILKVSTGPSTTTTSSTSSTSTSSTTTSTTTTTSSTTTTTTTAPPPPPST